jgi:phosphohistidine phosphatase SixA
MRRLAVLALLWLGGAASAADEPHAWTALAAGAHVALLRHANAPGTGDPQAVRIGDCSTQRNLDDVGREQARALGEAFRARKIRIGRIVSSPWCRTLETARLMELGKVEVSWSLVPDRGQLPPVRAQELKQMLSSWRGPGTLVLVSHGFAIQPLYGDIPASGEMLVLKPNGASNAGADLIGRIPAPR